MLLAMSEDFWAYVRLQKRLYDTRDSSSFDTRA